MFRLGAARRRSLAGRRGAGGRALRICVILCMISGCPLSCMFAAIVAMFSRPLFGPLASLRNENCAASQGRKSAEQPRTMVAHAKHATQMNRTHHAMTIACGVR